MAVFAEGDSVIVAGKGPGVVTGSVGAPSGGRLYHVTLTDDEMRSYSLSTRYTAGEAELTLAAALPVYSVGDNVTYQRRHGRIESVDSNTGYLEIVCEPDPPNEEEGVERQTHLFLPPWKLYLNQNR